MFASRMVVFPSESLPGRKTGVGTVHGAYGSLDDRIGGFLDVTERSELREQILEIPTDAGMLVGSDESDVGVVVQTGIFCGDGADNGATDAGVAHSDI